MWRTIKLLLLALCAIHLMSFSLVAVGKLQNMDGLLIAPEEPVAGDFINLYTAARMVLAGQADEIYRPDTFTGAERQVIPQSIGLRLWAYPPPSLLLAWPFGLAGFWLSLGLWSALGLGVLALGARRLGFDWMDCVILLLSPGALHCIYYGQTGNLVTGLLLLALSARRDSDKLSAVSAALLTLKPQMGFLLPVLWAIQRRWALIGYAIVGTLVLVGLSVALFGAEAWHRYLTDSLGLLRAIEREATGMFMFMIPSGFMSGRILGLDPDTAFMAHLLFAAAVLAVLVWRLMVIRDGMRQVAMVLLATPLISPYLHSYDLALLAAGALLAGRRLIGPMNAPSLLIGMLVVANWGLPNFLLWLNEHGAPLAPLLILALFLVTALIPARHPDAETTGDAVAVGDAGPEGRAG